MGEIFNEDTLYRSVVLNNQANQIDIARKCYEEGKSHLCPFEHSRYFILELGNNLQVIYAQKKEHKTFSPDDESVLTICSIKGISTSLSSRGLMGVCHDSSGLKCLDRKKNRENLDLQIAYGATLEEVRVELGL